MSRWWPVLKIMLVGIFALSFAPLAQAWSSPAARTESEIKQLSISVEVYRSSFGKLPPPENYWVEVSRTGIQLPDRTERPRDNWGRPFVYRAPGRHGDFDLYSLGADGIDQDGARDDISNWAGVTMATTGKPLGQPGDGPSLPASCWVPSP